MPLPAVNSFAGLWGEHPFGRIVMRSFWTWFVLNLLLFCLSVGLVYVPLVMGVNALENGETITRSDPFARVLTVAANVWAIPPIVLLALVSVAGVIIVGRDARRPGMRKWIANGGIAMGTVSFSAWAAIAWMFTFQRAHFVSMIQQFEKLSR